MIVYLILVTMAYNRSIVCITTNTPMNMQNTFDIIDIF